MIKLFVAGIPKPQARPRVYRVRGGMVTHSPKTPWFATVRWSAAEVAPKPAWAGPVGLRLDFYFPRPQAMRDGGTTWKPTRADLDNLQKAALDALSLARWWTDDAVVVYSRQTKRYAAQGKPPGLYIQAWTLN